MEIIVLGFCFVFGSIFGSFLNVLIYRLNEEKVPKFWQGRSFCPKCKHELVWLDNIPLISYVLLNGKCRYCKKSISIQYPVVEFVTGLSTIATYLIVNPVLISELSLITLLASVIVTYSLIVIFFSDLKYSLIPDEMVITFILGAILFCVLNPLSFPLISNLIIGLVSSFALLLIVLATKGRGLGLGDVKLAFPMGIFLGFPKVAVAFWIAFISGGVVALMLVLLRRKNLKQTIPLGPFLVFGTIAAFFWSDKLLSIIGL